MKVHVTTNKGDLEYIITEDIKIVFFKVLIALKTNIPVQNFCLKFGSVLLEDDKKLSEYEIKEGACLMTEEFWPPAHEEQQKIGPPGNRVYIQTLLRRLKALK